MAGRRKTLLKLLAALFAFSMIAAACGDSDSDSGDGGGSEDTTPAQTDEDQEEVAADVAEGDAAGEDTTEAESGPVHGGKLVYGIEADSANPWTHYATSCAISCRMILRTITDSLFITNADGEIVPYLVETVEPSEDYASWTMTIRDGISFHDGTPLDGAAVKYNIDACRFSPLTGPSFIGLNGVEADGQTVTLTYGAPEALGPKSLRAEVCGFMLSPAWMSTLANNPLNAGLSDEEKAELDGNPAAPVGLGAFAFESYTPGNGNSFVAMRNNDYWRGENGITGEELPYLDEVELVVAVDIQGRSNGLKSGQFDIMHTANADETAKYIGDDDFKLLQANDFGETSYYLINSATGTNPTLAFVRGLDEVDMDPGGLNATNPLVHLSCRKAFAHAIDRERLAEERGAGIVTPANGPFPPGSIGHLEDTGYPAFDIAQAQAVFETCKTDSGQNPVSFGFNTTNDAFNVETNELVASMWRDAFGDEVDVSVTPIEQGQYIGLALAGVFQAQGWRNHAGVDPSEQWYWWNSATASPIDPSVPELALNFGRFQDAAMDAAYNTIRQNSDPDARRAATEEVNRLFGENVWNWWTTWTLWGVMANPRLQNLTNLEIPDSDGATTFPVIAGKHHLTQIWCLDGDCQG
ncbi:MAG: ABC transporter substrate-binding protein [Actinomycetota bacterium]|nr:ABC transporter substrate-binding protein [Actinomycetota bacterium]